MNHTTPATDAADLRRWPCLPFDKVLALDYYDGPTEGLAWSDTCGSAWRFELLASDEHRGVRVYGLAPLPARAFTDVVDACSALGTPNWPVWVPVWSFPLDDERYVAEHAIDEALQHAAPPSLVVAAHSITDEPLAARDLTPNDLAHVQAWLSFVGLAA